jgi:peptide/nickel transport system permease protein
MTERGTPVEERTPLGLHGAPPGAGPAPVGMPGEGEGGFPPPPPPVGPASRGDLLLSALLPGAAHLRRGRGWGGALLFLWAALLALTLFRWDRIGEMLSARPLAVDEGLALAGLALLLAAAWATPLWDLGVRSRRPRKERGDSQWALAWRQLSGNRMAMGGLGIIVALYLLALLTPLIAPFDPSAQGDIVATRYLSPSGAHPMGTDRFGRDLFSRVLYGARISLSIGFIAMGIGVTMGTLVGALAGYLGGMVDGALMRFTDMMLSFPRLILLIVIIAMFDASIFLVVVVLGLTGWMGVARIVRGEVLSIREREFVQAAVALGMRDGRIIFRHVIPNVFAPVIVFATLGIGNTILLEAGLSFLGLGVPPPTPSWGSIINEGRDALLTAWWVSTFPGLAIVFTVVAFNLLGDGLRDALDPRQRS